MSKPNLFISYSRREVAFVDTLGNDLEAEGFPVWLDYRSLIPGKPWDVQIADGVKNAHVVVLVISESAMASPYVQVEWQPILANPNKQVILAIFESVKLPESLQKCEWVDFRGEYKKAYAELLAKIASPEKTSDIAPPQSGIKRPRLVWVAVVLSIITALLSLPLIWTGLIPWILFPLPYKIFKTRDYYYDQTTVVLLVMPIIFFVMATSLPDSLINNYSSQMLDLIVLMVPFSWGLALILRSKTLQRWGKPMATAPTFTNPLDPGIKNPKPVKFHLEHAFQDGKIAHEIRKVFTKYGHVEVENYTDAEAVLSLVSAYQYETKANPQQQVVFPIMIQTPPSNVKIDPDLTKIQWVDYRTGVRHLEKFAQLLPNPHDLLKALAKRPMGNQIIMPKPILFLMYFLVTIGVYNAGGKVMTLISDFRGIVANGLWGSVVLMLIIFALVVGLIVIAVRQIIGRKGFFMSWPGLIILFVGIMVLLDASLIPEIRINDVLGSLARGEKDLSSYVSVATTLNISIGMLIYLFFAHKDVNLWFPAIFGKKK